MPGKAVMVPSFFMESFRMSRGSLRLSRGDAAIPAEEELTESSCSSSVQSLTPFVGAQPALRPEGQRVASASVALEPVAVEPVVLSGRAAHLKSGLLKKRSQKFGSVWQLRFVMLEGEPTNALVYYYASATEQTSGAQKPRGVLILSVRAY
jgi:hypothetical protein